MQVQVVITLWVFPQDTTTHFLDEEIKDLISLYISKVCNLVVWYHTKQETEISRSAEGWGACTQVPFSNGLWLGISKMGYTGQVSAMEGNRGHSPSHPILRCVWQQQLLSKLVTKRQLWASADSYRLGTAAVQRMGGSVQQELSQHPNHSFVQPTGKDHRWSPSLPWLPKPMNTNSVSVYSTA